MSKKILVLVLSALLACACSENSSENSSENPDNKTPQCDAETGSCEPETAETCKDTEHLFATQCEADDVNHCGTHTNDCTKLSGWKSGSCIAKNCFAEACQAGYHLASIFSSDNKESTICAEDTHDACGSVNTKCKESEICAEGKCQSKCRPEEILCDGSCIDPQTSKAFCGADASCSHFIACSELEVCVEGKCIQSPCENADEIVCKENQQNICVNIQGNNPNHCGACGAVCSDKENAKTNGCTQGQCTYTCNENMVNCGSDSEPICLSDEQLKTDASHCGNACLDCNTANFASAGICQEGACVITACVSGYILKDGACAKCEDTCASGCNEDGSCKCPENCKECDNDGKCKDPEVPANPCAKCNPETQICKDNICIDKPNITFTVDPEEITSTFYDQYEIDFNVTLKNGQQEVQDQTISFTVEDASCVELGETSQQTDAYGTVKNYVRMLKPDCSTNVTAKATIMDIDYDVTIPVTIEPSDFYSLKLELKYKNASSFSDILETAYKRSNYTCAELIKKHDFDYDSPDGFNMYPTGNPIKSILDTFNIMNLNAYGEKSIVAWGKSYDDTPIAVGCVDISVADANQTVTVLLKDNQPDD